MTDMREELVNIITTHVEYCGATSAADAIIAALPGMVKPLVWEAQDGVSDYEVNGVSIEPGDFWGSIRALSHK